MAIFDHNDKYFLLCDSVVCMYTYEAMASLEKECITLYLLLLFAQDSKTRPGLASTLFDKYLQQKCCIAI